MPVRTTVKGGRHTNGSPQKSPSPGERRAPVLAIMMDDMRRKELLSSFDAARVRR